MGDIRKALPQDLPAVNRLLEQVLAVHHAGRPDLFNARGFYEAMGIQPQYTSMELLCK